MLVGFDNADDAGVYRLRDDLALVQTVDFFTPIVDDPFDFGRIAATNALSDIYAMGATPVSALNLVAFSLERARRGGAARDPARRRPRSPPRPGVAILGGHSIEDAEPKFGMAVTGVVHPDEILTNAGGQRRRRARADQAARRRAPSRPRSSAASPARRCARRSR